MIDCICQTCGALFQCARGRVAEGRGKYCSRACKANHPGKKIETLICAGCGVVFQRRPHRQTNAPCCSRKCYYHALHDHAHQRDQVCDHCGIVFHPHAGSRESRFCSRTCNSLSQRKRATFSCRRCGAVIEDKVSADRQYCSPDCHDAARYSTTAARRDPRKRREYARARRARENNAGGTYTLEQWDDLCHWFGDVCLACGATGRLTVDHVVPLSRGGSNFLSNLQPLCLSCNSGKRARTIDYRAPDRLAQFLAAIK